MFRGFFEKILRILNGRKGRSAIYLLAIVIILVLSLRGLAGVPLEQNINSGVWTNQGPLDTSNERGRLALTYALVENKSLELSLPLARFATPDLAISPTGAYVSLFAPAVSFLVVPGYVIGKFFGISQVGAYFIVTLFAIFNVYLIRLISKKLGANSLAAFIGGLAFLFATPAFSYGVSLYQHHISVFILLASTYLLLRWNRWWSFALVWFLIAFSVVVDNPNFFLMFPIGVFALGRMLFLRNEENSLRIRLRPAWILTFLVMIIPLGFFWWFNYQSNGGALQISGTLPRVKAINREGQPTESDMDKIFASQKQETNETRDKKAIKFFNPRNISNGLYVHLISPDRGMLKYAPVILFGIWGVLILYRRKNNIVSLFLAVILANILLYSMWGDPYGGWAFGSRYLIPTYAILGITLGVAISNWKKKNLILAIFGVVLLYSIWVNSLGAVTSNSNPPKVEVLALEEIYGKEQKYTYERNWDYLSENGSKSFVYQEFAGKYMSGRAYHFSIFSLIVIMFAALIYQLRKEEGEKNNHGKFE